MQKKDCIYSKAYAYDVIMKTLEEYIEEHENDVVHVSTIILMLKAGELIGRSSVQPE